MFSLNIFNNRKKKLTLLHSMFLILLIMAVVIDVYFKIKAFKKEGIKVNLHCFEYGRKVSSELEILCEKFIIIKEMFQKQIFSGGDLI